MTSQNELRVEHQNHALGQAGPVVTRARFVNVDGARVAYRVQGQGPAIVLVNGTAALDVHWGPVIGELGKTRTVVSLDYSGSGDTVDDGSALTLQKLANQVRAVAEASGVGRFDVIGHSLGASVAVQLATTAPDLVRSLVLVAGFPSGAEPRLRLEFELWLDLLRTNRTAFLRLLLLTGLTPAFISKLGVGAVEDMITGYMPFANWEGIERQVTLDMVADIRDQSRMVTCPTLVVTCAHDQIVTTTPELATYIPGSACREINAGHLAYFEGAHEFLAATEAFLSGERR
ncbi:alpha/beta hydrolase [Mesorhizobium sp. AR10]|uniref:alpha/beta fold hydrolase n=1 Tax=Mesorhizobium sp. AR10 TaxID=2865839 RepID=UPI00215EE942|nr:alpha/beta hydrolase [Mesorhizobium sp. AR10]UVK40688.1 alpha/beta hydrolase [Mesorhizobium sp. AR10]